MKSYKIFSAVILFTLLVGFTSCEVTSEETSTELSQSKINFPPPQYGWTHIMGGAGGWMGIYEDGRGIDVDSSGNVYVAGSFFDYVNFMGDWTESWVATDEKWAVAMTDTFISKINSDSSYGWTKRIYGGIGSPSLDADAAGNLFLANFMTDSYNMAEDWGGMDYKECHLDPDYCQGDALITMINADGSYGLSKMIGGAYHDGAIDIKKSDSGNIFVVGFFRSTVNFAADWGGSDIKIASSSAWNKADAFITKINAGGSYGWTKIFGGSDLTSLYSLVLGQSGKIYLVGEFGGTVNFGADFGESDIKISAGSADIFISQIDENGNYGWTKRLGGVFTDRPSYKNMVIDNIGNIYFTGYFSDTVNFAEDWGGSDIKTSAGLYDMFVTKLNSDGSYGWTRRIGGAGYDYGRDLAIVSNNVLYLAGIFEESVNFAEDFGGNDLKISKGMMDISITAIGTDGSYGWTKTAGGIDYDYANAMTVDSNGNIYVTGGFTDTVNFGEDFGISDVKTSNGNMDIFVMKLGAPAACGDGVDNDGDTAIDYPNDLECFNWADAAE